METNQLKKAKDLLKEAQDLLSTTISKDSISAIERDLILEKLRKAYDLMIVEHKVERQVIVSPPMQQATKVGVERTPEIPSKPLTPEIKPQVLQHRPEESSKDKASLVKESKKEPIIKKVDKPELHEKSIFESTKKEDPKIQTSSFKDKPSGEILADKYQGTRKFRNDALSSQSGKKDISSQQQNKPILDLTRAIGINDKFFFIKELFNGDSELYGNTLRKLNQFNDITAAMIFIHENFSWKSDNEAASRFIELVRRKLLNE